MESKPFWASSTLWANLLALGVALAAGFGLDLGLDIESQGTMVAGVMAVMNMLLRLKTNSAVTLTTPAA